MKRPIAMKDKLTILPILGSLATWTCADSIFSVNSPTAAPCTRSPRRPTGRRRRSPSSSRCSSATDVAVAIERATSVWDEYRNHPTGTVTLATFPTFGQMVVPAALRALEAVPGLRVEVSDRDPDLEDFPDLAADFDIVIAQAISGERTWVRRGLRITQLLAEPLDVVLPIGHRLSGQTVLTPADLADESWIGVPVGYPLDRLLRSIEAESGAELRVVQRVSDNRIAEAMVAAGLGIGLLPRFTASGPERGIVLRPLAGLDATRRIVALSRPDRAERLAVRTVLEAIRTEARSVAASHTAPEPEELTTPRWV
jgi:DNA-binding transcriptional LysR family regulator